MLALTLLGAAIAMAAVQLTNAIRHDARVQVELVPEIAADLEHLELAVWETGQPGPPAMLTVFNFDSEHRPPSPIEHTFALPNGRYELHVKLVRTSEPEPIRIRKELEVSGDSTVLYRLP